MGVEYNQPAHLLDRYIKGGDINGGRLSIACRECAICNMDNDCIVVALPSLH